MTPVDRWKRWAVLALAVMVAAGLRLAGANPAVAQAVVIESVAVDVASLDPADPAWDRAREVEVALTAQEVTYPLGGGTVPVVHVKSVHSGDTLFLAVRWEDDTMDASSTTVEHFSDAVAIEFPARPSSTVPAVCMGQADQGVNIWQWRADSEAGLEPLPAEGYVDMYPSLDDLEYPARAGGNPFALVPGEAVQNLVAGGFGTLGPALEQTVQGHGVHDGSAWTVVFARAFDTETVDQPWFAEGQQIDVAFAAWNGSKGERDGIKAVSAFVKLAIGDVEELAPGTPAGLAETRPPWAALLTIGGGIAAVALVVLVAGRRDREEAS